MRLGTKNHLIIIIEELENNEGYMSSIDNFCDRWGLYYDTKSISILSRLLKKHGYKVEKKLDYYIKKVNPIPKKERIT